MKEKFDYLSQIPAKPGNLMRGMQMIQAAEGFISDAAVKALCARFSRSAADVESILNFYPQFKRLLHGRIHIEVCRGTACLAKNPGLPVQTVRELAAGKKDFSVEEVDCLGRCGQAPAIRINGKTYGPVDKNRLVRILSEYEKKEMK